MSYPYCHVISDPIAMIQEGQSLWGHFKRFCSFLDGQTNFHVPRQVKDCPRPLVIYGDLQQVRRSHDATSYLMPLYNNSVAIPSPELTRGKSPTPLNFHNVKGWAKHLNAHAMWKRAPPIMINGFIIAN